MVSGLQFRSKFFKNGKFIAMKVQSLGPSYILLKVSSSKCIGYKEGIKSESAIKQFRSLICVSRESRFFSKSLV